VQGTPLFSEVNEKLSVANCLIALAASLLREGIISPFALVLPGIAQ
jgi:hypothetical protein